MDEMIHGKSDDRASRNFEKGLRASLCQWTKPSPQPSPQDKSGLESSSCQSIPISNSEEIFHHRVTEVTEKTDIFGFVGRCRQNQKLSLFEAEEKSFYPAVVSRPDKKILPSVLSVSPW
jgi:hypothetical protein